MTPVSMIFVPITAIGLLFCCGFMELIQTHPELLYLHGMQSYNGHSVEEKVRIFAETSITMKT
jgi:hypothetical protein